MENKELTINLALESEKTFIVPYTCTTTVEDICIIVCKHLNIGPIARHLFALRITGKPVFLMPNATIQDRMGSVEFRIRFKVAHVSKLRKLDENAYNYYFHQARVDVLEEKIPDMTYEEHGSQMLGLSITDMFRLMVEKDYPRDMLERKYKKFVPKSVLKKHLFFTKKPIHENLVKLEAKAPKDMKDASYIKSEYLNQLDFIAPEYLAETYRATTDIEGRQSLIIIKVPPPHVKDPHIKYCIESRRELKNWINLFTIEDLGDIAARSDGTTEISRLNGIPVYLKFHSISSMWSFVSLLDGYYRLTCKWTFNLCPDLQSPSLTKLRYMRCHGPVGGVFSYAKLEAKTNNRRGCFIIRESETSYTTYYIDVCLKDGSKPTTFKLECIKDDHYIFQDDDTVYKNLQQLINAYNNPDDTIYFKECLRPTEYDVTPLLLCRSDTLIGDSVTDSSALLQIPPNPVIINYKDLQVYKGNILIKWIQNEAPPGNLTDLDQCKLSHLGVEYTGSIGKTESNVRCQSWISNSPHKVNDSLVDDQFPYHSKKKSKNYCRNPDRKSSGPWCYTMNSDLIDETCTVPLCSYSECKLTGPGMEFGGFHNKGYSDRKCLKWDKNRKKVLENGTYKKYDKFPDNKFSDGTAAKAKNFCRNPDGDPGGPWCFVENELGYIEREYCDIEFCDDPECSLVAKDSITYMHFKNLNENVSEVKFGLKLWNSDSFDNASARIVLTVLALPLKSKDISDLGIGLELFISNKESALRYGNKDQPEYESTPGILTSSNFTKFILNWDRGFITLGLEGSIKPIFLAEINNKKNLMGHQRDHFNFYSLQGTDVIWNFPFCLEGCDVHTTTGGDFQQFIPLRQKDIVFDLYVYIRAFHSAAILFIPSPTVDYPYFKMVLSGPHGLTRFTLKEHHGATEIVLKEIQLEDVLDYWRWSEFSVSFFANSLQIYMKKAIGMHTLLESTNEMFRQLRWFSISSGNAVAHWTFFCLPPNSAQPPEALLPECAINTNEPDYEGTQAIISNTGLPCLPWSARNLIPFDVVNLFRNEIDLFEAKNYCRNPKSSSVNGTFCFVFFEGKILKQLCRLRKCKSQQCKMAGTGNDFIGHLNTTRSGRKCDKWDVSKESIHPDYMYSFNNSYFAEMNSTLAENFCRNPTRDISGSWCYTRDPQVVQDVCNVKDCDRPEELIIIISTNQDGRRIYVLPQWKEEGLHGGLKFSLKEWNPDLLSGIIFAIFSKDGTQELQLVIGAKMNEKVELILNKQLIESRTLPHLISAGIWTDFWLQMRKGEVLLGFRGVPTPLFEWRHQYKETAFEPTFLAYYSLFDTMPIGIVFQNDECHTENTTDNNFLKYIPIGLHSKTENHVRYNNLSMKLRGVGQCWISFLWVANSFNSYQIKIDTIQGTIGFYKVEAPPRSTKPKITPLIEKNSVQTMIATKWTSFMFSWTDKLFKIARNNESVLTYESERPILTYWFSVAAVEGWVTWSANCDPLDLDGPPIDGGWSQWSPWTCTVTCGGGEGFRTRTCSNPHPNIFGKLCQGNPTVTGVCNDFPCGDISPETLEEIQSNLKKHSYSFIVEEGTSIVLKNDQVMLKKIQKESPEAYFEWTLNGVFVTVNQRVSRQGDNVSIKNTRSQDSGIYVAMIYRPNGHRAVLRVITLAVKSKLYNVETRATWSYSLQCHSVILGYIYTDLSLKVMVDNRTYLDHGIVNLAAVNTHVLNNLNQTESGAWHCVVEQRDLKLKWTTNYIRINVKKKANFFTHIMEDKLTAPLFGYLNSEIAVVAVIITIVVLVFLGAVAFLMIYLKFCHLNARSRQQKEGFRRISHVYKGMWRVEKGKKIQVALKYLKHDHVNNFMSYFTMIGQWASVKSSVIVRFFGLTFFNNEVSMVMEYFKLGPLDQYLRNNKEIIKTVDLLEAASNLGLALWHLRENDIVHGMIRCRKLMVSCHEENSFTIKLSDHGIHTTYEESEIHWIPIECYSNLDKRSTSVDVWAFATTLYEIFTYGTEIPLIDHNQTMRWYMNDNRLPQPPCCPDEIYTLMIECWHADPYWRKQPQEISRDVNQFMYQVYNSRKKHSYDFARPRTISSNNSVHSALTENTDVGELISASDPEIVSTQSISDDSSSQKWLLHSQSLVHINRDESFSNSCGLTQIFSNLACSTATSSLDSLVSMQSIFELNDNFSVVLKGRIGQGFYGDVFKGSLENTNDPTQEPVTVAVKKLKSFAADNCVRDFHREITIMRSLNHPNIVEILGVTSEPDLQLVMEFMPHGSLQSYLKYNKDKLDSNQLLNFARDIARGMDYLGQKGIVHRDLASRNILVVDRSHVKISDFGLAQFVDSNNYYILKSLNRELPIKWYAPESLAEGKFSVKSDVWSYGVTLFETFTYGEDLPSLGRIHPYPEGQEQCFLLQAIQNGDRYPCPKDCEQTIYVNVMRPCWETDPHKRPPFKKLVSDINDLLHNY